MNNDYLNAFLNMNLLLVLLVSSVMSCFLTLKLKQYAISKKIIDIPNGRSSHSTPTPRGGGVSIVVTFFLSIIYMLATDILSRDIALVFLLPGGLIAAVGFLDDHGHIAARWRLLIHFTAASIGLYLLGGLPTLQWFGLSLNLGIVGHVLAAFFLVWMLNLYNFMDGIDGIASVEAITSGLSIALLCYLYPDSAVETRVLAVIASVLALCVSGFLIWNFPPAKIFMGDAGSGFLGIVLGLLVIYAANISSQLFWGGLILLGVFIVDASYTLFRRLIRGDKVYEAHRSHAYQYASRHFKGHLPVTLGVLLINIFWLLPLACLAVLGFLQGAVALLIAYIPLLILAVRFKAGEQESLAS